jgi:hypothetical protein
MLVARSPQIPKGPLAGDILHQCLLYPALWQALCAALIDSARRGPIYVGPRRCVGFAFESRQTCDSTAGDKGALALLDHNGFARN